MRTCALVFMCWTSACALDGDTGSVESLDTPDLGARFHGPANKVVEAIAAVDVVDVVDVDTRIDGDLMRAIKNSEVSAIIRVKSKTSRYRGNNEIETEYFFECERVLWGECPATFLQKGGTVGSVTHTVYHQPTVSEHRPTLAFFSKQGSKASTRLVHSTSTIESNGSSLEVKVDSGLIAIDSLTTLRGKVMDHVE
jgi:hypothetical protein